MKMRLARASDVPALIAVDQIAQKDASRRRWIRDAVRNRAVYVRIGKDRVVGYAILAKSFFRRPFVEMLYVAPEERRNGHGSEMLSYLETRAGASGEIWTSTNRSNRPMRGLLGKHGYLYCGRISGLDHGDPELFYVKRLPNKAPNRTRG